MYMAFVIHEDDEDHVSFYTRTDEGTSIMFLQNMYNEGI